MPILGLTATATEKVKDDIAKRLGINKGVIYFQSSFNRPNLVYEIRDKKGIKDIDRSGVTMWDADYVGTLIWDEEFSVSSTTNQMALLDFCK